VFNLPDFSSASKLKGFCETLVAMLTV
jgi:hypothetical protein